MRVIEIQGAGGVEVMHEGTRPNPAPKAEDVLIRVTAFGINRADTYQRRGLYPVPPETK